MNLGPQNDLGRCALSSATTDFPAKCHARIHALLNHESLAATFCEIGASNSRTSLNCEHSSQRVLMIVTKQGHRPAIATMQQALLQAKQWRALR
jgi:hypothetical protein